MDSSQEFSIWHLSWLSWLTSRIWLSFTFSSKKHTSCLMFLSKKRRCSSTPSSYTWSTYFSASVSYASDTAALQNIYSTHSSREKIQLNAFVRRYSFYWYGLGFHQKTLIPRFAAKWSLSAQKTLNSNLRPFHQSSRTFLNIWRTHKS